MRTLWHTCAVTAASVAILLAATSGAIAADSPFNQLGVQTIDTSKYPTVRLVVSMPGNATADAAPAFELTENGKKVKATSVEADTLARETKVVLLLDTSGSMTGGTWAQVKDAASSFLDDLSPAAPVSLVAFDETRRTIVDFTTDREAVRAEIARLSPARETALYDTIVSASRSLSRQGSGRKAIVLFSDGGDTVSASTFDGAMGSLDRIDVPLYSVFLRSYEENPRVLKQLSERSGGRFVPASRTDELPAIFEDIAQVISGVYVIEYQSLKPTTTDVEVDIDGQTIARSASARIAYPNPAYAVRPEPTETRVTTPLEDSVRVLVIAGLSLFAITLLVFGLLSSMFRERSMLSQMQAYDQRERRSRWRDGLDYVGGVAARLVRAVDGLMTERGYTAKLEPRFEAAGLTGQIAYYTTSYLTFALAAVFAVFALTDTIVLAIIVAAALGWAPFAILDHLATRKKGEIEEQMLEVLAMLSTSLRAGWTLERTFEYANEHAPQPTAREFGRVMTEIGLGMPPHVALEQMGKRIGSPDFDALVAGISVQREVGGNLADVVDAVIDTVRERDQLRRQMRTLTSEARLSAYILVALPFIIGGMMFLSSRSYIIALFQSAIGLGILAASALMIVAGGVWVFRIAKVEV